MAARRDTRVGRFPNWRDVDPSFAGSPRESRPRKGLGGVPVEGAGRADLVMFRADLSGWHQRGSPVCPPPAPGHVALRDFLPPWRPRVWDGSTVLSAGGQWKPIPWEAKSIRADERRSGCPWTRAELERLTDL